MKRISLIIVTVTIIGLGLYFLVFGLPFLFASKETVINNSRCKSEKRALDEDISGVVVDKYRDKESHMWETIKYSNSTGVHKSVVFMNEHNLVFDLLMPGDTIVKAAKSLKIKIIRGNKIKEYQLDFECNN